MRGKGWIYGCFSRWILPVIVFLPVALKSQNQANNWYFGFNAGITFSGGSPTAVFNGALSSDEGVSSISDANGGLLFYSNGNEVYNKQHQLMPNGSGLSGHYSTSQSSIIVPSPADDSIYFLFTVPAQMATWPGAAGVNLCYSIVNMRLQNGLGDIQQKNIPLVDSVCEKITATRHANKKDIWVTVHRFNGNAFYTYPVTCNGVGAPVISNCGSVISEDYIGLFVPAVGCMKISYNGSMIAQTWTTWTGPEDANAYLEIADFDNTTGVVSNPVTITHSSPNQKAIAYGVEFSPSSQLLYWSENGLSGGIGYNSLFQFDVTAANISATEYKVASPFTPVGSLQCGPDNKLYIARLNGSKNISVVQYPDVYGSGCSYDDAGISVAPNYCTWGLPNNWDTYPVPEEEQIFLFDDTLLCAGQALLLDATYTYPDLVNSYQWNTGAADPVISVTDDGLYTVNIYLDCDTLTDSVNVAFQNNSFSLGDDVSVCYEEKVLLKGPSGYVSYLWNTSETGEEIEVADTGSYVLFVTDTMGCVTSDTILLSTNGCGCGVFIPNAITINDDGRNDALSIYSNCRFSSFKFRLYNRWGQPVFHTNDPAFSWSGMLNDKNTSEDVYCYTLEYASPDAVDDNMKTKTGTIVLLK